MRERFYQGIRDAWEKEYAQASPARRKAFLAEVGKRLPPGVDSMPIAQAWMILAEIPEPKAKVDGWLHRITKRG